MNGLMRSEKKKICRSRYLPAQKENRGSDPERGKNYRDYRRTANRRGQELPGGLANEATQE